MNTPRGPLKPSTRWSDGDHDTWGPYWDVMFAPAMVTAWIDWKRGSTGVNIARALWEEREYLRRTYESVYGTDPAGWPSQHPGVILSGVPTSTYAACLRCSYFDPFRPAARAVELARRHETSDGTWRGTATAADNEPR